MVDPPEIGGGRCAAPTPFSVTNDRTRFPHRPSVPAPLQNSRSRCTCFGASQPLFSSDTVGRRLALDCKVRHPVVCRTLLLFSAEPPCVPQRGSPVSRLPADRARSPRRFVMKQVSASLLWLAGVVVPAVLTVLAVPLPAGAMPPIGKDPPPSCVDSVTVSFYASRSTVLLGESTTLRWNVQANGCNVTQTLNGASVARYGSRVEWPTSNHTWRLTVRQGSETRSWSAPVTSPCRRTGTDGSTSRSAPTIRSACSCRRSAARRARTRSSVSRIMSAWISVTRDRYISLSGSADRGRAHRRRIPGPLLFTTTYPDALFVIGHY